MGGYRTENPPSELAPQCLHMLKSEVRDNTVQKSPYLLAVFKEINISQIVQHTDLTASFLEALHYRSLSSDLNQLEP